jgi:hypothetical protein
MRFSSGRKIFSKLLTKQLKQAHIIPDTNAISYLQINHMYSSARAEGIILPYPYRRRTSTATKQCWERILIGYKKNKMSTDRESGR